MYYPERKEHPEQRIFAMFLYIISAMGAGLQLNPSVAGLVVGMILVGIVWFMNKAQMISSRETFYFTHAQWLRNTLAFGGRVFFPASYVIGFWLIYKSTDIASVQAAMKSEDLDVAIMGISSYLSKSAMIINNISIYCLTPAVIWWVWRCYVGFRRAHDGLPVDDPGAWF